MAGICLYDLDHNACLAQRVLFPTGNVVPRYLHVASMPRRPALYVSADAPTTAIVIGDALLLGTPATPSSRSPAVHTAATGTAARNAYRETHTQTLAGGAGGP
jgi:hypothetical protein